MVRHCLVGVRRIYKVYSECYIYGMAEMKKETAGGRGGYGDQHPPASI